MVSQYSDDDDQIIYKVVGNDEEQYSIWPDHKENPLGWSDVGKVGPKAECLAHIKEIWTDMRPLSLRKQMAEMARNPQPAPARSAPSNQTGLVDRLCDGEHPVVLKLDSGLFRDEFDSGYLRFKFTDTTPGTELAVRLDKEACDVSRADLTAGRGVVRLIGNLSLDYTRVRCVVDLDLETLAGQGHLERMAASSA